MNKSHIENDVWRSTVHGDYGKLLASCMTMQGSFCPPADRVPGEREGRKEKRGREGERGKKKMWFLRLSRDC